MTEPWTDGSAVETVMSSNYVLHGEFYKSLGADDSRVFSRVSGGVGSQ